MNDISELMYVADPETYELLFINDAGRETFGVDVLAGQKCYRVLQNADAPCSFCTNHFLKDGETYTWEYTNPVTGRHYLLKDRLIEWTGALPGWKSPSTTPSPSAKNYSSNSRWTRKK